MNGAYLVHTSTDYVFDGRAYDFARAALELAGVAAAVEPITSAELAARAPDRHTRCLRTRASPPSASRRSGPWQDALVAHLAYTPTTPSTERS